MVIATLINKKTQQTKNKLNTEIQGILKQAIGENGQNRNKDVPRYGDYNNRPEAIGTYETRTFQSADTTFTYKRKIVDLDTELFNENQFYLLFTDNLHSKDLQLIFDRILQYRLIEAKTSIKIVASGYLKQMTDLSKDTTQITIDGRAYHIMDDGVEKISYTAYLDYSRATLWQRMSKQRLYILGTLEALLGIAFMILLYYNRKKSLKIVVQNTTIYRTKHRSHTRRRETIILNTAPLQLENTLLRIEGKYLISHGKQLRIAPQSLQILQLFLNTPNHRVSKNDIKELWTTKHDRTSNMTTAINRINKSLLKLDCPETIFTDPEDKDYYLLALPLPEELIHELTTIPASHHPM